MTGARGSTGMVARLQPPRAAGCARWRARGRSPASMSIWAGVEHDRPLAHLEPRRQGVDEPRQDGRRVEADHAPHRAGHAEIGLVGRPAGQDPLVAGDDVRVRADDERSPARRGTGRARSSPTSARSGSRPAGSAAAARTHSSSSVSASVNGFSIGCMYVRPWRLITATRTRRGRRTCPSRGRGRSCVP